MACDSGHCIEVYTFEDGVVLLSSTETPGLTLPVSDEEWQVFRDRIKAGDFDKLPVRRE